MIHHAIIFLITIWSVAGGMFFILTDSWEFEDNDTYLQRLVRVALFGPIALAGWLFLIFGSIFYNAIGNKK